MFFRQAYNGTSATSANNALSAGAVESYRRGRLAAQRSRGHV